MSFTRIYQSVSLTPHTVICLDEKASHHLVRVLRARVGDKLKLFNSSQFEYEAVILRIHKKEVEIEILGMASCKTESPLKLNLAQGIARGEKMDFIIQKAVELGIHKITPLWTERCNVSFTQERVDKRLAHWQAIAVYACEQSGRSLVPEIVSPVPFKEWLTQVVADGRFVLSPHTDEKLPAKLPNLGQIEVLIGPEGGLSEQEVMLSRQYGFLPLNLGPRILRTETASIAALSILQFHYGDM